MLVFLPFCTHEISRVHYYTTTCFLCPFAPYLECNSGHRNARQRVAALAPGACWPVLFTPFSLRTHRWRCRCRVPRHHQLDLVFSGITYGARRQTKTSTSYQAPSSAIVLRYVCAQVHLVNTVKVFCLSPLGETRSSWEPSKSQHQLFVPVWSFVSGLVHYDMQPGKNQ